MIDAGGAGVVGSPPPVHSPAPRRGPKRGAAAEKQELGYHPVLVKGRGRRGAAGCGGEFAQRILEFCCA